MAAKMYEITARTAADALVRCDSTTDLADFAALVAEYAADFAGRADVRIELDTVAAG